MANLYSDSNMYITDVSYGDYGGNNCYNVSWAYTSNNDTREFTVLADNVIQNVISVGRVETLRSEDDRNFPTGNAYTTAEVSQSSTSGSGSGCTIKSVVDQYGFETISTVSSGTSYAVNDTITYPGSQLHRDYDLTVTVIEIDGGGINYFPTGLSDADVVSNALPLMNVEYGFN